MVTSRKILKAYTFSYLALLKFCWLCKNGSFCVSLVFVCAVFACFTSFFFPSDDVFLPREDIEVGISSHCDDKDDKLFQTVIASVLILWNVTLWDNNMHDEILCGHVFLFSLPVAFYHLTPLAHFLPGLKIPFVFESLSLHIRLPFTGANKPLQL